ncbi:MAG: metalloregulator ArsR/SmtB family transcription factor [Candidatus Eremiobacterota bacterium]
MSKTRVKRIDSRKVAYAAEMLRVMGHPVRLRIVELLEGHGELPAGAFHAALEEPQPTVSQHLNKMRALGLLKARREGGQVLYSVAQTQLFKLLQCVRECQP